MNTVTAWPVVLPNDHGIRPAGPPDACFYCGQKVGQRHGADCVCVLQRVQYGVYVDGIRVGSYQSDAPYFWTSEDCDFHKNGGNWCADNAVEDGIQWEDSPEAKSARDRVDELMDEDDVCCCSLLEFRFETVVVDGPFRYEE